MRVVTRVATRLCIRVLTRAATGALTLGVVEGFEELATMAFLVVLKLLISDFFWIVKLGSSRFEIDLLNCTDGTFSALARQVPNFMTR